MDIYENWWEEKRSAYLYEVMAENETHLRHKKLFNELKEAALKQATMWETAMKKSGIPLPAAFLPNLRTRIVATLVKILGTANMHSILSAMKIRGMSVFKQYHSEHRHTSLSTASNLRAAIFGINDGLISNMSLILGVAGASTNQHFIIVTGIAGLLAGACSMGAGEYISVLSQREVFEYQIAIEKQELEEYPEEEAQELSYIYQARGLAETDADKLAQLMINNPATGLDTLAREELGLNPEDLVSPYGAMIASFFSFALGAFLPVLPFLIQYHPWNVLFSMIITAISLFGVGTLLSLFTNRNPFYLGLRLLIIGGIAGGLTFLIGKLVASALS